MKDDYAKWEPEVPSVNFTINEHSEEIVDNDGHFGIEMKSVEAALGAFLCNNLELRITQLFEHFLHDPCTLHLDTQMPLNGRITRIFI